MNIAIISSTQHNMIGGTETYARNLIKALSNNNSITEFPIQLGKVVVCNIDPKVYIDNRLLGWKPNDMVWGGTYTRKNMDYIFEKFDIIIWNNCLPSKKLIKHKKSILIQHESVSWYKFSGKGFWLALGGLFSYLFFGVSGTIGNPFKKANAPIFFDEVTSCETLNKKYFVNLPSESSNFNSKRSNVIWLGRIENKIKNIKDLIYIANNTKLDIYGKGPDEKLLKDLINQNAYKGFLNKKLVSKTISKYKVMALTSNWEGFPFVMVEAMHAGTPVVFYDKFDSASIFKSSGACFIVKNKNEALDKIKWLQNLSEKEYSEISNRARKFAHNNFSFEVFNSKWKKIVSEVFKNNEK